MEAGSARVLQLVADGEISQLVAACEELELAIQEESLMALTDEQVATCSVLYSVHLLAYLLEGEMNAARFLWKRTPTAVQQHAQAEAAHRVLAARWRRQYPDLFRELAESPWESRLQPLVAEVVTRTRSSLVAQIGQAYKAISVERAATMLGLDAAAARALFERQGWPFDEAGNALPMPPKRAEDLMQMGTDQLDRLAEYVAYLEQPQCRI